MKLVKAALYTAMVSDASLMALLVANPYEQRLPMSGGAISESKAAIVYRGDLTPTLGSQEEHFYELHIYSKSHDLNESVARELRRIFRPSDARRQWASLAVGGGERAHIRLFGSSDIADETSELRHLMLRFRVLAAKAVIA